MIVKSKFDLIIDLQNSMRTKIYGMLFRLLTNASLNGTHFSECIILSGCIILVELVFRRKQCIILQKECIILVGVSFEWSYCLVKNGQKSVSFEWMYHLSGCIILVKNLCT